MGGGGEEARDDARGVVGFPNGFGAVAERAVTDRDVMPAEREVLGVHGGEPADGEFGGQGIFGAMPARAFEGSAEGSEAVDGGEGEGFGLAVAPAEAAEDAEVLGEFLIGTDARSEERRVG